MSDATEGVWHCPDREVGDQAVPGPCGDRCSAAFFELADGRYTRTSGGLEPIHCWFQLSYANYLVLHRSILQSMPTEWQQRFVACLSELDHAAADLRLPYSYSVQVKNEDGKFCFDEIPHYDRGRTKLDLAVKATCLTEDLVPFSPESP